MKFYSPVGKGVSLLRAQGSVSYVQSDKETYDMDESKWIDNLATQYGCRQSAALSGRKDDYDSATFWLQRIADNHWHEIINALRGARLPSAQNTYVNRCAHEWYQGRCIHCDIKAVDGRPEQPDKVPAGKVADDCGGPARVIEGIGGKL